MKRIALASITIALAALSPGVASAQVYGDDFGLVPGSFFAGTCDLPDFGTDDPKVNNGPDDIDPTADDWHCGPSSASATQAGAHPDATAKFEFKPISTVPGAQPPYPDGNVKDIVADIPAGLVGNPEVMPKCKMADVNIGTCPIQTQVGVITLRLNTSLDIPAISGCNVQPPAGQNPTTFPWFEFGTPPEGPICRFPVWNVQAGGGRTAAFAFLYSGSLAVQLTASVRPDDHGLRVKAAQVAQFPAVSYSELTLWGVPGHPKHDPFRFRVRFSAGSRIDPFTPNARWPESLPVRPFLTNPTSCDGSSPVTKLTVNSWQHPEVFHHASFSSPPVTGCDQVPFDPSVAVEPTSAAANSASGVSVDITTPQTSVPDVLSTAHLKKAVVTLPQGMSINPSAADGLRGCSDEQIAIGTDTPPACPDASKIGTAEVFTPVLPAPDGPGTPNVGGDVYLGTPRSTDPASGEMFRMFLVLRNDVRGLLMKIPGSAVADPVTGRLTATFDNNPQLPFETLNVKFKGGPRGLLAMPQRCGPHPWSVELTPWSAHAGGGGQVDTLTGSFEVAGDCSYGFSPGLLSGMDNRHAGANGSFSFAFSRTDGEQWFSGLTAELPTGLLASIRGVPLCSAAQASAGACPAESRIGSVDASAGTGDPFVLERKGDVYLTEGYKGGAYGLAVGVPVEAGPFRGAYALNVDPTDAHITVISDPLPTIWHGIPLRVRQITVNVDRPGFMVNPTSCSPKQVKSSLVSTEATTANVARPFHATGCAALPFRPKMTMRLTGRRQTTDGKHPGLRTVVTQRPGEANLKRATVRLPLSLALDPDNAQALCEFEDGQKVQCPASSIIGRAKAMTPLLNKPLEGPVYFVKNVRVSRETGRTIRTLPTLLIPLRGEVALNLRATTTVKRGKLVTTFPLVPDSQISRFELNLKGGKGGIIVVTNDLNLCRGAHVTEADLDGQNAKRLDRNVRMATPCPKEKPARLKPRKAR